MNNSPISVAMCTYNGARFLRRQLESIAAQSMLPAELLICDDLSTDDTLRVIRDFARIAPFVVKVEVNEQNVGSNRNFEKTIGTCCGTIIVLSDQDDVWEPRKLEVIAKVFNEQPDIGYVFSDAELIDENDRLLGQRLWEASGFTGKAYQRFCAGAQVEGLLRRSLVTGATMAFRASLVPVLAPFSPCVVHDYWISLVASCVNAQGAPISDTLVRYRQHAAQQIGAYKQSIRERAAILRSTGNEECERARIAMADLRERLLLARLHGYPVSGPTFRVVEEKLVHCSRRANAQTQVGLIRAYRVLSELITGRYRRFSNSWRSVIVDLCC